MAKSAFETRPHPIRSDSATKRPDARREATRLAIIEAAESLFAEQGIDAVSLRQIGAAIGAKNPAVVSYHFGDKEALIEAILAHRLPSFERRRAELASGIVEGAPDMVAVLRILMLPLFEQRNARGRRSYAVFLSSLGRSQWSWVWSGSGLEIPVTLEIGRTVEALMPSSARGFFWERMIAVTALITATIEMIDRRAGGDSHVELVLFEDGLRMAAAALSASGT